MDWERANMIAQWLREYGIRTAVYTFDEREQDKWAIMCMSISEKGDLYITSAVISTYKMGG